jgi:hypothetical protein
VFSSAFSAPYYRKEVVKENFIVDPLEEIDCNTLKPTAPKI